MGAQAGFVGRPGHATKAAQYLLTTCSAATPKCDPTGDYLWKCQPNGLWGDAEHCHGKVSLRLLTLSLIDNSHALLCNSVLIAGDYMAGTDPTGLSALHAQSCTRDLRKVIRMLAWLYQLSCVLVEVDDQLETRTTSIRLGNRAFIARYHWPVKACYNRLRQYSRQSHASIYQKNLAGLEANFWSTDFSDWSRVPASTAHFFSNLLFDHAYWIVCNPTEVSQTAERAIHAAKAVRYCGASF